MAITHAKTSAKSDSGDASLVQPSDWNADHIGGMTNPMTTVDDVIIGGASGVPARLAKGADGQVLTVDPTTHHLAWATPGGGGGGSVTAEVNAAGRIYAYAIFR